MSAFELHGETFTAQIILEKIKLLFRRRKFKDTETDSFLYKRVINTFKVACVAFNLNNGL